MKRYLMIFLAVMLLVSLVEANTYEAPSDDWWMFGGNSALQRYTTANAPANISDTVNRTVTLASDVDNGPIIVGDLLYIAPEDFSSAKSYKLNALNISEILETSVGYYEAMHGFNYYNGFLYFNYDNYLYQVNSSNISQVIDTEYIADSAGWYGAPTIYDGSIYASAGNYNPYIRQFNASNISQILSSYYIYSRPYDAVSVYGENAYAGVSGILLHLNSSDLSQKISQYTCSGGSLGNLIPATDEYVYKSCQTDSVTYTVQLNASDISQQIANFSNGSTLWSGGTVLAGDYIYFAQGSTFFQVNASNVSQQIANYTMDASVTTAPIATPDYVFIGASTKMYQFDASDISSLIGTYTAGGAINGDPVVAKGFLYFGATDNKLYQLGTYNPLLALNVDYPVDGEIYSNVTEVNYTVAGDLSFESCWYSNSSGAWNSGAVEAGIDFGSVDALPGVNSWTVYCNDSEGSNYTDSFDFTIDVTAPSFGLIENQTIQYSNALVYQVNAIDDFEMSCFSVNDSVNFDIDCSGNLTNRVELSVGLYWLNITVNDSVGFENSTLMFVNVTPKSLLGLEWIYPVGNISVTQNEFFNMSVNVSCSGVDCGEVNVTLDPATNSTPKSCSGVWGASCAGADPGVGDYSYGDCSAGSYYSSGFWVDDAHVNASIVALGDTINITCDYDCYSTSSYNDIAIMYYNGTWNKIWRQDSACTDGNYSVSVEVSGDIGEQYARCSIGYYSYPNDADNDTCFDTTYSDNDDVNFTVIESSKSGTVSMVVGDTPFYTNVTNPYNLTLDIGESQIITWWVNATGDINTSHQFFAYTNKTSDGTVSNITSIWNITIMDNVAPTINLTYPLNASYDINVVDLNYSYSDANNGYCWYSKDGGVTNSSTVAGGTNWTGLNSGGGSHVWTLYCNDSSGNEASDSVGFASTIPAVGLTMIYPTNNVNVLPNEFFEVRARISCLNGNCGDVNVTLDPKEVKDEEVGINFNVQSAIILYDNKSFDYDIQDGCYLSDGEADVFDTGLQLQINGSAYSGSRTTTEDSGREALCTWQTKSLMNVSRKVYVPVEENWARFLEVLNNPSESEICVDVKIYQNMGSDGADFLNTSDGDLTWELSDHWMMWDDSSATSGDDAAGFIYQEDDTSEAVDTISPTTAGGGANYWIWEDVCVEAGETKILMHYFTQWDTRAQSEAEADILYENFNNETQLLGLNDDEKSQIANWGISATKSGTISMVEGTTPFYTNTTNPYDVTLGEGESEIISWWVNATGDLNTTHEFFVYANMTSDETVSDITSIWNVSISLDATVPLVSLISPLNNSGQNSNITFSYNVSELNELSSCSLMIDGVVNQTNTSVTKDATQNFTLNGLGIGNYNWSVRCLDNFSNIGDGVTRFFSVIEKSEFVGDTTNLTEIDVSNITNLILDSPSYGKVNFSEVIDLDSGADINEYVNISFNRIEINSTALPALNKSARLRLYNLTFSDPRVLKDDIICTDCSEVSYSGGTFVFDVNAFSIYSAEESPVDDAVETPAATTGGGGGGGSSNVEAVEAECIISNDCNGGYSCYAGACVKLFDVEILKVSPLIETLDFELEYLIKGMADIEGDVIMKFWIVGDSGRIDLGQDAIYLGSFEEKIKKTRFNLPLDISNGTYDMYAQVNFENYNAESFRKINILIFDDDEIAFEIFEEVPKSPLYFEFSWLILVAVFLAMLIFKKNEMSHLGFRKTVRRVLG